MDWCVFMHMATHCTLALASVRLDGKFAETSSQTCRLSTKCCHASCRPSAGCTRQLALPTKVQPIINRSKAAFAGVTSAGRTPIQAVHKAVTHCIDACDDDDDFLPEL